MKCGIIVPRREDIVGYSHDSYMAECILVRNHLGPHVIELPGGKLIAWENDWECGCCKPEEDDRCFLYWEIQESDIPNLSKG